jgi:toxin ParE1/3/4
MRRTYKLTNKAVDDLTKIWEYTIEKWSEQQADKYYAALIASCQAIADNPEMGKNYVDISTDLFGFRINRHIIFYRKIADQPIEITRILHERMDLKNRLND